MSGDPRRTVTFTHDGRTIEAPEGTTVGAALWAHGDRALSRSTKYHRPRGWACGTGRCGNCLMRIDGLPNRRACMEPVREGLVAEGQNAWPTVRHDIFRVNDIVFRRGLDHHHGFVRPRILYPLFGAVIRGFAGWGRVPDRIPSAPEPEMRRVEVLIIGGGPAGLAAAREAARSGAQVLLVDEHAAPGGTAAWFTRSVTDPDEERGKVLPFPQLVARWRSELEDANIEVLTRTAVAAAYPNGVVVASARGKILVLHADAIVIATGGTPSEAIFGNNDLPGIMTTTGCLALLNRDGVRPGRRAVVYGAGAHGLATAMELHDAGIEVVRIAEPTNEAPGPAKLVDEVRGNGIRIDTNTHIDRAHGWGRVRGVTLVRDGSKERVKADLVVVALGHKTLPFLFQAMGAALTHDAAWGGTVPILDEEQGTSVPGLFAAGDAAGITSLRGARTSGALAGRAAAAHATRSKGPAGNPPRPTAEVTA